MSTITEFYIDKEKRELINTINSAKYVSEEQKEVMIDVLEDDRDDSFDRANRATKAAKDKADHHNDRANWYGDTSKTGAGDKADPDKADDHMHKSQRAAKQHQHLDHKLQNKIKSVGDAQKYYDVHGRAPDGYSVKKGKVFK